MNIFVEKYPKPRSLSTTSNHPNLLKPRRTETVDMPSTGRLLFSFAISRSDRWRTSPSYQPSFLWRKHLYWQYFNRLYKTNPDHPLWYIEYARIAWDTGFWPVTLHLTQKSYGDDLLLFITLHLTFNRTAFELDIIIKSILSTRHSTGFTVI